MPFPIKNKMLEVSNICHLLKVPDEPLELHTLNAYLRQTIVVHSWKHYFFLAFVLPLSSSAFVSSWYLETQELQCYRHHTILSAVAVVINMAISIWRLHRLQSVMKSKVCKSEHHRTIQINHHPHATIFQFIILTFIYSSTCFGRFPAFHQELIYCSGSLLF
jgi:hypothetical protein